jgi:secreted PhoX family phosphatase
MSFDPEDPISNPSSNARLTDVLAARCSRRRVLAGGLVAASATLLGPVLRAGRARAVAQGGLLGFAGVPISRADAVTVPPGYTAEVLYAWGDPISAGPAFKPDASNGVEDQAVQAGMHHDGIHFFPLPVGGSSSTHGLLAINHEYTDDGLLHPGGMEPWTAEKVRKSQS